ncbi:adult cuticle protein 1-like [Uranotaenia lowii]|nr:adult cuticle protein 1-like [Uranotaenia lowii]XP_055593837.1 adult cuticle protein 1-like [Uranotaenia lowii]XP_055595412.1 adult cuticle protein 1-like [Uranotaenia lowii]
MKCIAAVVMMVLAVAAVEGTYYPLAYSAPLAYSVAPTVVQQNHGYGYPLAYSGYGYGGYAPISYAAQASVVPTAYAAYAAPAPVAVVAQREARYVAANRGAVHDAPLQGHAVSQQSLNLQPAPGTL